MSRPLVELPRGFDFPEECGLDVAVDVFEDLQFFFVLADDQNVAAKFGQHLSTQISQAAIAEHDDSLAARDKLLAENLIRRRDRLGKNCNVCGE